MVKRDIIHESVSPDGLWKLQVEAPINGSYYALFLFRPSGGPWWYGFPFGFEADPSDLSVDWNLPDSVCGLYVRGQCYGLFRYGPRRRRRRVGYRVGEGTALS